MRWLRWWIRRPAPEAHLCRRCDALLRVCTRCEGAWFAQSCAHCTSGAICPVHRTSWF